MGLRLRLVCATTGAVSSYHKQSRRPRAPVAKLGSNPIACYGGDRFRADAVPTLPCDTIPIKRVAMDFGTSFACSLGADNGKRSKSAVVTEPVQRRGVARRIV